MSTFIEKQEDLLTKEECSNIIKWVTDNHDLVKDTSTNGNGYYYNNLMEPGEDFGETIGTVPELRPIFDAIIKLIHAYVKHYPEVTHIGIIEPDYVRFKWWKPGNFFSRWHSEHALKYPYRVLSFLIYLSDNDCSTEFLNYRNVRTKAGRGIMFPSYFTHEHRGSPCGKGLDRYIISGYFGFKK